SISIARFARNCDSQQPLLDELVIPRNLGTEKPPPRLRDGGLTEKLEEVAVIVGPELHDSLPIQRFQMRGDFRLAQDLAGAAEQDPIAVVIDPRAPAVDNYPAG